MNNDPGSLQNLNDIVVPAAVPWWPLAPAWYVLAGLLLVLLAGYGYRLLRKYHLNRYRRVALKQLQFLQAQSPSVAIQALPVLLKQVALAIFPRRQVAALSGDDWSDFLDKTSVSHRFSENSGKLLAKLSYTNMDLNEAETQRLFSDAESWIRHHQVVEQD